jgi:hypothetical protein
MKPSESPQYGQTILLPGALAPAHWLSSNAVRARLAALNLVQTDWMPMASVQAPSPTRQLPHEQWLADTFAWTSAFSGPRAPIRDWFAIPVQLTVGLDHLVLSEVDTPITERDGEVLALVIEPLLADSGIRLVRHRMNATEVWQLHIEDGLSLEACTPLAAIGRNTQALMPEGADGARWRKLVHEIEMAWHCAGPDLRFASAEPFPVNSLWLAAPTPAAPAPAALASNPGDQTAPQVTLIDTGCALTQAQIEASLTQGSSHTIPNLWMDARALQPRLLGDLEGWLQALEATDALLVQTLPNASQLVLTGSHTLSTWAPPSSTIQTPSPWSFQGLAARVLGPIRQTGQTSQTSQTSQPRAAHTIFTEPT